MNSGTATLGEVAQFVNGVAFKPDDWSDTGSPIIRIQNLTDPSKPYNRTTRKVPDKLHVRPGDLLVSWSATLGVFDWRSTEVGLLNQHIFRVIPRSDVVDKQYLRHVLSGALASMKRHLHGATMQHVNRGEFLSTPIPLPSLEEQRGIADILDRADNLRTKRRDTLTLLDDLTQSIFLDMFGDVLSNPRLQPVSTVGQVSLVVTDGEHQTPKRASTGIRLLSARNVRDGYLDLSDVDYVGVDEFTRLRRRLDPRGGDLLISCSGSIGRVAQVRGDQQFAMVRSVALVRPDPDIISSTFLEHQLRQPRVKALMQQRANSSSQANLFQKDIRPLPVLLPPPSQQQEFEHRVATLEPMVSADVAHQVRLDNLFSSLQQRAFAGEL